MTNRIIFDYSIISSEMYEPKMENHKVITINKNIIFDNYNVCFFIKNAVSNDQWVIDVNNTDLGYVAFFLNDPAMLKNIFGLELSRNRKIRVKKSMISKLHLPSCNLSTSKYYSLIETIFQTLYTDVRKDDLNLLMLDFISAIRLALSFELHYNKVLDELNISIFSNWKDLVDANDKDLSMIFAELLKPGQPLMSNVRKFQILLNTIKE